MLPVIKAIHFLNSPHQNFSISSCLLPQKLLTHQDVISFFHKIGKEIVKEEIGKSSVKDAFISGNVQADQFLERVHTV